MPAIIIQEGQSQMPDRLSDMLHKQFNDSIASLK